MKLSGIWRGIKSSRSCIEFLTSYGLSWLRACKEGKRNLLSFTEGALMLEVIGLRGVLGLCIFGSP